MKCAIVLFLSLVALAQAAPASPPPLALGAPAPEFKLPGVDGRTWSLADFKEARLLVVVFTCNHCPTAQYYEPRIKQLVTDYRPRGVALVAISPNDPQAVRPDELGYTDLGDSLADMQVRARDRQFNFPYLFGGGEQEAVSLAYGPAATPHVFVFDADRKLRYAGRIDDSEREADVRVQDLRRALDSLLADREPPVTQTKVFGCSTKWSSKASGVQQYWEKAAQEPVELNPADAETLRALRQNAAPAGAPGRLRLINVWATWCGPCVTEFPDLVLMQRMYGRRDFELVTVAAQYPDEQAEVLRFLKQQKASCRNLIFAHRDKYALLEALDPEMSGALPSTLLVDADGRVIYRREGPVDALELRRKIVAELNRRKPW